MDPNIAVKEIMTKKLHVISPEVNYQEVRGIFNKNNFHHLLVMDDKEGLVGIISQRDLLDNIQEVSFETSGKVWTKKYTDVLKARDIMTPFPMVLDPDDTIGLAADIFLANQFHALPIVESGELLGIVTTHDLLRYAFNKEFLFVEK